MCASQKLALCRRCLRNAVCHVLTWSVRFWLLLNEIVPFHPCTDLQLHASYCIWINSYCGYLCHCEEKKKHEKTSLECMIHCWVETAVRVMCVVLLFCLVIFAYLYILVAMCTTVKHEVSQFHSDSVNSHKDVCQPLVVPACMCMCTELQKMMRWDCNDHDLVTKP